MKRTLALFIAFGLAAGCSTETETTETETAAAEQPEQELLQSKELPYSERLRPDELRSEPVIQTVSVDEEALAKAPVLMTEIGPEGTTIEVLKAAADDDGLIVQMRVENVGENVASFRMDPAQVLARTPDLSVTLPALAAAADSSEQLSRDEMTVSVEPGESEIVSFQFQPPEREVAKLDLHLPATDPIEGLTISWPEEAEKPEQAQADSEETATTTTT